MQNYMCHIHSLNGDVAEAIIHKKIGDNQYLAEYGGVKCTAIFNPFVGAYYIDDKYGIIPEGHELLADIEHEDEAEWGD